MAVPSLRSISPIMERSCLSSAVRSSVSRRSNLYESPSANAAIAPTAGSTSVQPVTRAQPSGICDARSRILPSSLMSHVPFSPVSAAEAVHSVTVRMSASGYLRLMTTVSTYGSVSKMDCLTLYLFSSTRFCSFCTPAASMICSSV